MLSMMFIHFIMGKMRSGDIWQMFNMTNRGLQRIVYIMHKKQYEGDQKLIVGKQLQQLHIVGH